MFKLVDRISVAHAYNANQMCMRISATDMNLIHAMVQIRCEHM